MSRFEAIRSAVLGQDFNGVRRLLGPAPIVTAREAWTLPAGASPSERDRFEEETLYRVWVYADAVVTFNLRGVARRVTDDAQKYTGGPPIGRSTFRGGAPGIAAADEEPKKLPPLIGGAAAQAWESLAPIPDRPVGARNIGVVLMVHDVESKRVDFASRSDADIWQAVHTISDLVEALRALVGDDKCISGLMTSSHGGWRGLGGFRMGDDDDGDGLIEGGEAQDFVSTAAQAQRFGEIIRGAFCWCERQDEGAMAARAVERAPPGKGKGSGKRDGSGKKLPKKGEVPPEEPPLTPGTPPTESRRCGFISVESCGSSGTGNAFITSLHNATGLVTIGSDGSANVGGSWLSGAWWEADDGRSQVNADGTTRHDATTEGTGVWRPF